MKKRSLSIILCLSILMTGCQSVTESSETADTSATSFSVETSAEVSDTDTTTDTKVQPDLHHDYIPQGEGYFSLFDIGYGTQIKAQLAGTCWAHSASTGIESVYKRLHDRDITIDPISIVSQVYTRGREEGFLLKDGIPRLDAGGDAMQVVFTGAYGMDGGFTVVEAEIYDPEDVDLIKSVIRDKGAVIIGVPDLDSQINYVDNYITLHAPDAEIDHAVVLVGWDDDFPKEYFVDGPEENGAWLAQNSSGGSGLYWISYETMIEEPCTITVSDEYSEVAGYDCGTFDEVSTGDQTTVANVFHQAGNLSAVGLVASKGQHVSVEVMDGQFGDVLATVEGTFDEPGYYVLELPEELEVSDYTIAATYDGTAPIEGSPDYEDILMRIVCISHPGLYSSS